MKKINTELRFCIYCMKEHEIDIVEMMDIEIFKDEEVTFKGTYEYCPIEDELVETEDMIRANFLAMKKAYKNKVEVESQYNTITKTDLNQLKKLGKGFNTFSLIILTLTPLAIVSFIILH